MFDGKALVLSCCDMLFPCEGNKAVLQQIMALQLRCVAMHGMLKGHFPVTGALLR